jgi:hypothetical protein
MAWLRSSGGDDAQRGAELNDAAASFLWLRGVARTEEGNAGRTAYQELGMKRYLSFAAA